MSSGSAYAELHTYLAAAGDVDADEATLTRASDAWQMWQQRYGVTLLDDHDPYVAPGLHVPRAGQLPSATQLHRLGRSWEAFERAFEACSPEDERYAFDTRLWPFVLHAGLAGVARELAADHLFVIDARMVASLPSERWDAHAMRHADALHPDSATAPVSERVLRGLRRVTRATPR